MLHSLKVESFTVFRDETFSFGKNLNVFVGENGTGKTHLLKLPYAVVATCWELGLKGPNSEPTKAALQKALADKLVGVFRPDTLGRLASRIQGRSRSSVELRFQKKKHRVGFNFTTQSKTEVSIDQLPQAWIEEAPVYLPTRELLTIYPGFLPLYEGRYLEFEETWRDTCVLLGAPLKRGPKEKAIKELLAPLEKHMGGTIELDKSGRFYLVLDTSSGRMEMPLVAEGLRKLGMLARLIATGALLDKGALFWDEPEANLNPRIVKQVAQTIIDISKAGIQVFIASHSLFLLRELEMLLAHQAPDFEARFFGLHRTADGVQVSQGPNVEDMGEIAILSEELTQSDRFLTGEQP